MKCIKLARDTNFEDLDLIRFRNVDIFNTRNVTISSFVLLITYNCDIYVTIFHNSMLVVVLRDKTILYPLPLLFMLVTSYLDVYTS